MYRIEQCANCGHYLESGDDIVKFNSDDEVCRSVLIGYCCSLCGYFEEV